MTKVINTTADWLSPQAVWLSPQADLHHLVKSQLAMRLNNDHSQSSKLGQSSMMCTINGYSKRLEILGQMLDEVLNRMAAFKRRQDWDDGSLGCTIRGFVLATRKRAECEKLGKLYCNIEGEIVNEMVDIKHQLEMLESAYGTDEIISNSLLVQLCENNGLEQPRCEIIQPPVSSGCHPTVTHDPAPMIMPSLAMKDLLEQCSSENGFQIVDDVESHKNLAILVTEFDKSGGAYDQLPDESDSMIAEYIRRVIVMKNLNNTDPVADAAYDWITIHIYTWECYTSGDLARDSGRGRLTVAAVGEFRRDINQRVVHHRSR